MNQFRRFYPFRSIYCRRFMRRFIETTWFFFLSMISIYYFPFIVLFTFTKFSGSSSENNSHVIIFLLPWLTKITLSFGLKESFFFPFPRFVRPSSAMFVSSASQKADEILQRRQNLLYALIEESESLLFSRYEGHVKTVSTELPALI